MSWLKWNGYRSGNGTGLFRFTSGDAYEGQWQGGRMHGRGIYAWAGGFGYEGEFKIDKKDGFGTWSFADGTSWEGPWRGNEPSGPGTWRFPDGLEGASAGPVQAERAEWRSPPRRARSAIMAAAAGGGSIFAAAGGGMIMFHGTDASAARSIEQSGFRPSTDGMLGRGVYVSRDVEKARAYGSVVLRVSVRVGTVKRIDRQGHPQQKSWHAAGYDTAWVPAGCGMVPSGKEEDCVYDPARITVLGRA